MKTVWIKVQYYMLKYKGAIDRITWIVLFVGLILYTIVFFDNRETVKRLRKAVEVEREEKNVYKDSVLVLSKEMLFLINDSKGERKELKDNQLQIIRILKDTKN